MQHEDAGSLETSDAGNRLTWLSRPAFWFVIALIIRMLYLLEQGGSSPLFYMPLLDEQEAVDSAREILNDAIAAEPYFKAPGYSWILAAVMAVSGNAWPWAIRALQHICGAWLVAIIAAMSARLVPAGRSRIIAVAIAGALATTYAPLIRLENNLSLDFWSVFFQTAMLAQLMKAVGYRRMPAKHVLIAGLLLAAAWLVRPTITLTIPVLFLWVVYAAKPRLHSARSFAMALLFIVPLIITGTGIAVRNQIVSGEALIMPWQGGFSFFQANKAGANGRYYLQSNEVKSDYANPARALAITGYINTLPPEKGIQFQATPDYSTLNRFWFRKARSSIDANPTRWLSLMGKKTVYLVSDKEIFNYEDFDLQRSLSPILQWLPGRFGVAFPLALASLAIVPLVGARRKLHALLWVYSASLGFAIALYFVSGRMRMPLAAPAIALAGGGAAAVLCYTMKRRIFAIGLILLGCTISWPDWWGVRSESMAHADLARMSNAAWHRNRPEQALDYALQAERLAPDYPVLPRLKAQALYNLGRIEEAKREFEKSVHALNDDTSKRNLQIIRAQDKP